MSRLGAGSGFLAVVVVGFCAAQPAPEAVRFEHKPRGEGVAAEPREAFSPDRKVVARSIGAKRQAVVRLFAVADGTALGPAIDLKAHRLTALAVAPDGKTVATAVGNFSNDWGEVRVWDGTTGKEVARYTLAEKEGRPPLGEVFSLSFSKDGRTVAIVAGPAGGK